jgi:hypothetical protein
MIDRGRIQEIQRQIREILMRDWDPIGVHGIPEAADEYDMYIGGIYGRIVRGASVDEIEQHLRAIEVERIELVIPDSRRAQVANSLKDLAQSIGAN